MNDMLEQIWGVKPDDTPLCDCGKAATWLYGPGYNDDSNPFFCDDCVPRGCSCADDPDEPCCEFLYINSARNAKPLSEEQPDE